MADRYEVDCPRCGTPDESVDVDGDWVRYDDHEAELTALRQQLAYAVERAEKDRLDNVQQGVYIKTLEATSNRPGGYEAWRLEETIGSQNCEITCLRQRFMAADKRAEAAEAALATVRQFTVRTVDVNQLEGPWLDAGPMVVLCGDWELIEAARKQKGDV